MVHGLLQERRERHRQNYMHVTIHTSQTWADTFISELNDTHVEAELRTKHIPPQVSRSLYRSSSHAGYCQHPPGTNIGAQVTGSNPPVFSTFIQNSARCMTTHQGV